MSLFPTKAHRFILLFFTVLITFSCSKDSDLLADYVNPGSLDGNLRRFVVDDTFLAPANANVQLNVLANDTFPEYAEVKIKGTSNPGNGSVSINEDNTLTYSSNEPVEGTDIFTYTTEVVNQDATVSTETGTVSVTISDEKPTDVTMGELKAFPGAEGFGKNASGGRGGKVVEVTNLNDDGPGSFREALSMKFPRTIVFKVGGTIECKDYLSIPIGSGDLTIAGQTAPGGGILIKNGELRIGASNVIIRYLRFRSGSGVSGSNLDGIKIRSFQSEPLTDVIIDHCSVSWGQDENISITNAENVTLQNSIVSESQYGLLIQDSKNISIIKNLFALNHSRNILANTVDHFDLTFEMVNNLIYGFKWATSGTDGMSFNVISNKYKLSKDFQSTTEYCVTLTPPGEDNGDILSIETTHAYLADNTFDSGLKGLYRSELNPYVFDQPKYKSTYVPIPINSLESDLLSDVGAIIPKRDVVDNRILSNYTNSRGQLATTGTYPTIEGGNGYADSDKDGISDSWEVAYGLNNQDSKDGILDINDDGFSNLETFLHFRTTP